MSNKQNKSNKSNKGFKPRGKGKKPSGNPTTGTNAASNADASNTNDNVHVSSPVNDANYYFSNELLMRQVSTFSFDQFTDLPIPMGIGYNRSEANVTPPAIMTIALNPSAGFTDEGSGLGNALNLTSLGLYTQLSAENAKTTNYGPQNISILLLALGSLLEMISHIQRVFGCFYLYSQRNRSYPRTLIETLGVNYDDLKENFADYRNEFNALLVNLSKIPIPANIAYLKKCSELYSGLYLDMEGSPMAQVYAFKPYSVWLLEEDLDTKGSTLVPFIIENRATMSTLLVQLSTMIDALLASGTMLYIYSDILRKADKGLPLYTFTIIPEGYAVEPMYVPEIRMWINNATVMGAPLTEVGEGYTRGNSVQANANSNQIIYRPQFNHPTLASTMDKIVNFDHGNPTTEEIVYATRLMAHAVYSTENNGNTIRCALPDHYVVNLTISSSDNGTTITSDGLRYDDLSAMVGLTAFDWSPMFPVQRDDATITGIFGDLQYYTVLDFEYISRLQDTTYFGLFEMR